MTSKERLESIREKLLAAIDDACTNPKPNYSIDGQSVSHSTHLSNLFSNLEKVDVRLASLEPVEIISQLYS